MRLVSQQLPLCPGAGPNPLSCCLNLSSLLCEMGPQNLPCFAIWTQRVHDPLQPAPYPAVSSQYRLRDQGPPPHGVTRRPLTSGAAWVGPSSWLLGMEVTPQRPWVPTGGVWSRAGPGGCLALGTSVSSP